MKTVVLASYFQVLFMPLVMFYNGDGLHFNRLLHNQHYYT